MTYPTLSPEVLQQVLSTTSPHSFKFNIARMHGIYRLPMNEAPTLESALLGESALTRLDKFKQTMMEEINEWDTRDPKNPDKPSVREKLLAFYLMDQNISPEAAEEARQDVLTDIADWLADMIVYCRSEAMKFGLALEDVQDAVMGSNFTKLSSDGIPKYDANGKFLKDMTNFVPPEPAIKTILFGVSGDTEA